MKDGRGKVKDYVAYFKELNPTAEQAKENGLLNTAIGRSAYTISNAGSESLIASHANDAISDQAAVAIAQNAPGNEALQNLGMKPVLDGKSIKETLIYSILSFPLLRKPFLIRTLDSGLRRNDEQISVS